ncbi:MAG: YbhB/YbcL family Raf kinase inhibitor-like protein [Verrucomicrobia bacterium]|nr:YbhB/YbcL family Raf kinase inhibitor-like protein [Verrucomicrobiota bacterium]
MQLTSPAFTSQGKIPSLYTCDGKDINPELHIAEVPKDAKSLVLLMDDPDVPKSVRADQMWDHWVLFNLPPTTTRIPENASPNGISGRNTGGSLGYQGPCPPDREHRYFFKLYALDCTLSLPPGSTKKEVLHAMEGHILAEAHLMGKYERGA